MPQLPLPLPPTAPWSPVAVERFDHGRRGATVRLSVRGRALALRLRAGAAAGGGAGAAEVALHAETDAPGARRLVLRVRRRPIFLAEVEADAPMPLHWGLGAAPALADEQDVFGYALRWGTRALAWGEPRRAWRRAARAAVAELLGEASRGLAAACEPGPLAAARRFLPAARARVYGLCTRDPRGWLAQAVRAAPGAVLLGLGLADRRETAEAGVRLLHDLGEGRRLDAALDDALAAWEAALPAWSGWEAPYGDDARRAWRAAAALDGPARARQRLAQRLLVRRAGPRVEPALLLLPPPARFAPEDVPAAPADNARWFRVMKVAGVTLHAEGTWDGGAAGGAFGAFASRHAAALGRPPAGIPLGDWLAALREALQQAERTPSRDTDPARVAAAVDLGALRARPFGWRRPAPLPEEAGWAVGAARAARVAPPRPPRPIELVHFPPWASEDGVATVTQLTSADQVAAEGARQRNCVATYLPRVEGGGLVICTAEVRGRRLTLALARAEAGWRLSEIAGFANRDPTPAELAALGPWFRAARVEVRGGRRR